MERPRPRRSFTNHDPDLNYTDNAEILSLSAPPPILMSRHHPSFSLSLLIGVLALTGIARANDNPSAQEKAADAHSGKLHAITEETAAWAAKAKANYPTALCIVSGEDLSTDPEEAYDFIYREPGKPDRFVSFCCDGCSKDFGMDTKRFLGKLDEAAAAKK